MSVKGHTYPTPEEVQEEMRRVLLETNAQPLIASSFSRFTQAMTDMRQSDENFQANNGRMMELGADARETAASFTNIHIHQMRDQGVRPSLPMMALHAANEMGLERDSAEFKAMMLIALKAEVVVQAMDKNEPDYHNRLHFIDVATMTLMNMQRHNEQAALNGTPPLTPQDMAVGFMAAVGHDIGHPGGKNQLPGEGPDYDRLRLERQAIDLIGPLMDAAGMSGANINKVNLHIEATSPDGATQFKDAMLHAINNGEDPKTVFDKQVPMAPPGTTFGEAFPSLKALADDPKLLQTVAMVGDADVYGSAGAGFVANHDMSVALTSEWEKAGVKGMDGKAMDLGTDAARHFFIGAGVVGGSFASGGGQQNGNDVLDAMKVESIRRMHEEGAGIFNTKSPFYNEAKANAELEILEKARAAEIERAAARAETGGPKAPGGESGNGPDTVKIAPLDNPPPTTRFAGPVPPEAAPDTQRVDLENPPPTAPAPTTRFAGPVPSEAVPDTQRVDLENPPPTAPAPTTRFAPEAQRPHVDATAAPPPAALGAARIEAMIQEELRAMRREERGIDSAAPTVREAPPLSSAPTVRADGLSASKIMSGTSGGSLFDGTKTKVSPVMSIPELTAAAQSSAPTVRRPAPSSP